MKKPNFLMTICSVAACKLTRFILRRTGRGGTAVPGTVAMKVSKNILSAVSDGMEIVVVTGTNGKTTTCNMIEHALTSAGYDCLLNKSGANLLHGIAADLICSSTWRGKPKKHYAVLECDEAALKQLVSFLTPKAIVITNLFSDQVDRYGGVRNTLKEIRTGVEKSPDSVLVLNAEDPLSASLSLDVPNKVIWYGLDETVGEQGNVDLTDAGTCPKCGGEFTYDYHVYAHLGGFRCSNCGFRRQVPDVSVTDIEKMSASGSTISVKAEGSSYKVQLALPAVYNIYNAAAAIAAAKAMNISLQKSMDSLSSVHSSFGRLETFDLKGNRLQMILVKNPAGCNQAFSYVTGFDEDFHAVLCLNDRTGDGHDISWINDTDYEKLCSDPHLNKIYAGGDRAADLAERLKKAGADESKLIMFSNYNDLLELLKKETLPIYAMPNYTAMMELRTVLCQATGSKDFWE